MRAPDRDASLRLPLTVFLVLSVAIVSVVLLTTRATASTPAREARHAAIDPRLTRPLYVDQTTQSYRAALDDSRFAPIGFTAQAEWLSARWMPMNTVSQQVGDYADLAVAAGATPLVAIYAIPQRDCGGFSSGGWRTGAEYKRWITKVAGALKGSDAMAILEPDALGQLGKCPGQGNRLGLIRYATNRLSAAGVWVYIDAAHNGWVEPELMAQRLVAAGIDRARGFSVDVASSVRTPVEKTYAAALDAALVAAGHGSKHYLMDTSRNGRGKDDGDDWCNPLYARLGHAPEMIGGATLDGYVWAKRPGESDGPCHGGPSGGLWWPWYALHLMGKA